MIVEHAILTVCPGQETAFERVIAAARVLIAASPGFHGIAVHPASETPGTYLLLVHWRHRGAS